MELEVMELCCLLFATITFWIIVYQDHKAKKEEAEKKLAEILGRRK